jgi:hypothetical protein
MKSNLLPPPILLNICILPTRSIYVFRVTLTVNNDNIRMVNKIFVTWKLNCVSCVSFHAELQYVIRTALSPAVFVWQNFLKFNFSKFSYFVNLAGCFKSCAFTQQE